ncbi:MAG: hypothetical protein WD081_09210 [Gammaproteobacteria bacterium]
MKNRLKVLATVLLFLSLGLSTSHAAALAWTSDTTTVPEDDPRR